MECLGLKPCCVGDSGMCGVMYCRTSLSSILEGLHRSETVLYDARSVGGLFGFRSGMILACFHMLGI